MTPGTKIALAVIAVFVAVVVVYYGLLMSPGEPSAPGLDEAALPPPQRNETPGVPGPQTVRPQPPPVQEPSAEDPHDPQDPPAGGNRPADAQRPALVPALGRDEPVLSDHDAAPGFTGGAAGAAVDLALSTATRPPVTAGPPPGKAPRDGGTSAPDPAPSRSARSPSADSTAGPAPSTPEQSNQAASASEDRRPVRYRMYTVRTGDTLSSIARWWFDDPNKWDLIAAANPSLADPDRVRPGQVLRLPPKDARRQTRAGTPRGGERIHTVLSGETLSAVAEACYGDAALWKIIYDANRTTIGEDPDALEVGMRLTIPPRPR